MYLLISTKQILTSQLIESSAVFLRADFSPGLDMEASCDILMSHSQLFTAHAQDHVVL